jgi:hypothetical protein
MMSWPRGPLNLLRPNTPAPLFIRGIPLDAHAEGGTTTAVIPLVVTRVLAAFI